MNTRIMKKQYKRYLEAYLPKSYVNCINVELPLMTKYGVCYTVKQRYHNMIQQRTRCNEFTRQVRHSCKSTNYEIY